MNRSRTPVIPVDSCHHTRKNRMMSRATLITVTSPADSPNDDPGFVLADFAAPQARVTDLGLSRGDGVFETIGVIEGHPQALEAHLRRLAHSARLLDMPDPNEAVWRAAVLAGIADYQKRNGPDGETFAKLVYTRGVEGQMAPSGWVFVDLGEDFSAARAGIRVITLDRGYRHDVAHHSPWLLTGAKTLSYAVNRAALREATRRGVDDVIFVSSDGYVLEGPTSTVVMLTEDGIVTPATNQGILAGTTQETAFEFLRTRGYSANYREIETGELAHAAGLWLVSSVRQAAPVTWIDGRSVPVDVQLTNQLNAELLTPRH